MTYYILIPGFHEPSLTPNFVSSLKPRQNRYIFPNLPRLTGKEEIICLGFSAGVVVALGLAWQWQAQGNTIKALIALDGWGVALGGNFPVHRCSHDYFTHWSSALLGTGQDNFYAQPAVTHLELWGNPEQVRGWRSDGQRRYFMTLTNYLESLFDYYD